MILKKKNVVKKETREKRTHERTPVRVLEKKPSKPVVPIKPLVDKVYEEKEQSKRQHNKKPKPAPVETVEVDNNIENNE